MTTETRTGIISTEKRYSFFESIMGNYSAEINLDESTDFIELLKKWQKTNTLIVVIDDDRVYGNDALEDAIIDYAKHMTKPYQRLILFSSCDRPKNDSFFYRLVSDADVKDIILGSVTPDPGSKIQHVIDEPTSLMEVEYWKTNDVSKFDRNAKSGFLSNIFGSSKKEDEEEKPKKKKKDKKSKKSKKKDKAEIEEKSSEYSSNYDPTINYGRSEIESEKFDVVPLGTARNVIDEDIPVYRTKQAAQQKPTPAPISENPSYSESAAQRVSLYESFDESDSTDNTVAFDYDALAAQVKQTYQRPSLYEDFNDTEDDHSSSKPSVEPVVDSQPLNLVDEDPTQVFPKVETESFNDPTLNNALKQNSTSSETNNVQDLLMLEKLAKENGLNVNLDDLLKNQTNKVLSTEDIKPITAEKVDYKTSEFAVLLNDHNFGNRIYDPQGEFADIAQGLSGMPIEVKDNEQTDANFGPVINTRNSDNTEAKTKDTLNAVTPEDNEEPEIAETIDNEDKLKGAKHADKASLEDSNKENANATSNESCDSSNESEEEDMPSSSQASNEADIPTDKDSIIEVEVSVISGASEKEKSMPRPKSNKTNNVTTDVTPRATTRDFSSYDYLNSFKIGRISHRRLSPSAEKIIAVAALRNGVGCTHLCCTLGAEIANDGLATCVALRSRAEFNRMRSALDDTEYVSEDCFKWNSCDFYFWSDQRNHARDYEVVICDCGTIDLNETDTASRAMTFKRAATKVMIAGGAPWDLYQIPELFSKYRREEILSWIFAFYSCEPDISTLYENLLNDFAGGEFEHHFRIPPRYDLFSRGVQNRNNLPQYGVVLKSLDAKRFTPKIESILNHDSNYENYRKRNNRSKGRNQSRRNNWNRQKQASNNQPLSKSEQTPEKPQGFETNSSENENTEKKEE